jgi:uncharacterized Rmd1/YagE family protein
LSEKLVLLPETDASADEDEEKGEFGEDGEGRPPRDDELAQRRIAPGGGLKDKSYAERLPKARRAEKLSRVTAYCTAQAYKMKSTAEFVKTQHHARTKLYDDCLYTVYHLPLLGGSDGYRVRSSPTLKSPGGKSMLDEEIERNELIEYHEGYFEDSESYSIRGNEGDEEHGRSPGEDRDRSPPEGGATPQPRVAPNALSFGEMFVFSYGVAVFWNFTEKQERDILADLTFSTSATGVNLATRPLNEEDFETEEFHFEYNEQIPRPRVYNDMITLKSGDHMIKLAMSHAIAQSTKLSLFEERMSKTMQRAQYIPKTLALTGKLGMGRTEVVRMVGSLFTSRVDVNLCKCYLTPSPILESLPRPFPFGLPTNPQTPASNMLDTPNFFWDSEPTLHPLYTAIREYLEIQPRIQVLNERCRVFLDLGEILSDSISDKKMTRITWIIIILIVISICITCLEVLIRFAMLHGRKVVPGQGVESVMRRSAVAGPAVLVARGFVGVGRMLGKSGGFGS